MLHPKKLETHVTGVACRCVAIRAPEFAILQMPWLPELRTTTLSPRAEADAQPITGRRPRADFLCLEAAYSAVVDGEWTTAGAIANAFPPEVDRSRALAPHANLLQ